MVDRPQSSNLLSLIESRRALRRSRRALQRSAAADSARQSPTCIIRYGDQRAKAHSSEDFGGGAQYDTKSHEPLTESKIRAVARDNPIGELFHEAANLSFGELAPYTVKGRGN